MRRAVQDDGTGYIRPISELTHHSADMDGYLTSCGGWQVWHYAMEQSG
jgi:hypothetical protein